MIDASKIKNCTSKNMNLFDLGYTYKKTLIFKSFVLYPLEPVSYTHLDVYKRQMKCVLSIGFDFKNNNTTR